MMQKAVLLDRDGVINRKGSPYYIYKKEDFILNDGIIPALSFFQEKGYLLIVITNQGGVAKGLFTEQDVEKIHEYMIDILKIHGINLTAVYYCPHHPDISLCNCRKPGTLLFEKAIEEYKIDPKASWMIGDSNIDIEAAEKFGIKCILIPENGNLMDLVVKSGLIS